MTESERLLEQARRIAANLEGENAALQQAMADLHSALQSLVTSIELLGHTNG